MTVPAILDRIADAVLKYRPRPKSVGSRKRARKRRKHTKRKA